jgi:hypothetical protein
MPIKSVTDQTSYEPGRGFPRLGKFRPGDKKIAKSGAEYPVDLDYFRVTFEPQYAHLEPAFRDLYGNQPKEFQPVFVMGKTADEAFPNWMEAYTQSALQRRCDGEHMTKWIDPETGRYIVAQGGGMSCMCPHLRAEYERQIAGLSEAEVKRVKKPNLCQRVGRLNLLLPAFMDATGVLGFFAVETGSVSNIRHIFQVLSDLERILGTLQGVPLVFGRAPTEMTVTIDGERKKVTKALFYLRATETFTQQHIIRQLAGFQSDRPALPTGIEVDGVELTDEYQDFIEDGTRLVSAPSSSSYVPCAKLTVDWDESDKFLTYVFDLGNLGDAFYTGSTEPFKAAGISADTWEPGSVVTFNPPCRVTTRNEGGDLVVASVEEYRGQVEEDRLHTKFR